MGENAIKSIEEIGETFSYVEFVVLSKFRRGWATVPLAFVLVNVQIGSEREVLEALKKVEGVEEAYVVYGVYDIVAKVKAENMDELKGIVTYKIKRLDKVQSTQIMMVYEEAPP